ncbi:hypothetical protein [Nocardia asiatica]
MVVAMRSMWQQVHTPLTRAAELAREPEDRRSCKVAALMAHELAHPEQIDYRHDINRRIMALTDPAHSRAAGGRRAPDDSAAETLSAAARAEDGWATSKKVVAALKRADPEWMPERWGYTTDLGLLYATGRFDIRKVDRPTRRRFPKSAPATGAAAERVGGLRLTGDLLGEAAAGPVGFLHCEYVALGGGSNSLWLRLGTFGEQV